MNWINTGFYWAIAVTGLCWAILRLRPLASALPQWLAATLLWFAELFWVVLIIFLLRSLVWEPFRIPSASMMPTLEAGDFIVVNKYQYGMRLPGINYHFTEGALPSRGDVIVFRYPPNPTEDYIKRLVGLPGDVVEYTSSTVLQGNQLIQQKVLKINDHIVRKEALPASPKNPLVNEASEGYHVFQEQLGAHHHLIREREDVPVMNQQPFTVEVAAYCDYNLPNAFRCKIPAGQYFMMGDNRDESADSRYWGFVPAENIVGRAFHIWFNMWKFERLGAID